MGSLPEFAEGVQFARDQSINHLKSRAANRGQIAVAWRKRAGNQADVDEARVSPTFEYSRGTFPMLCRDLFFLETSRSLVLEKSSG